MRRLVGAALLILGGAWAGLRAAGELRRRERSLWAWLTALRAAQGELDLALPTLPDLLLTLSRQGDPPAGAVFARALEGLDRLAELPFEALWTSALEECDPAGLTGEDRAVLAQVGRALGRYSREDQCAALRAVCRELEARRDRAAAQLEQKGRTYGTVGLALGVFLTILLL